MLDTPLYIFFETHFNLDHLCWSLDSDFLYPYTTCRAINWTGHTGLPHMTGAYTGRGNRNSLALKNLSLLNIPV